MMQQVVLGDAAWSDTVPIRVAPYPDEWLVSVLLRCDEVNHWGSGETFRYLLRLANLPGFLLRSSLLVAPFPLLECFAQVLLLPPQCLVATTYADELARLYPDREPRPGLLLGLQYDPANWAWRRRLGQRELATERKIHLCPACIAEKRAIRRITTVPHLRYCSVHRIALQGRCPCGRALTFFVEGTPPFTCYGCRLDWAQWPHMPIPPDRVALERDSSALYEFFLVKGTHGLKTVASRLARQQTREQEWIALKLTEKKVKVGVIANLNTRSLGYVVNILVSIGISPKDIAGNEGTSL